MRTPILLAACLIVLIAFQANAQVQKSDQNLGFGFDISSIGGETGESRLNLFVTYSYFLSKNLSIGVGPRYGRVNSSTENPSGGAGGDQESTVLGGNLFINYNFLTSSGFALPYFGLQGTHASQKSGNSSSFTTTSLGGNLGIKFFLTERLNVDNSFSITRVIVANQGLDADATVMQINVGLGYIIGRKN